MVLEAIRYSEGSLSILNQLKLPHQVEYDDIHSAEDGWHAIKSMRTRGAPAIAIVAALSLAVELMKTKISAQPEESSAFIKEKLDYLVTSRPTAVNLADAATKLKRVVENAAAAERSDGNAVARAYCNAAAQMLIDDVSDNKGIGEHGAEWILKHTNSGKVSALTHCNTGSVLLLSGDLQYITDRSRQFSGDRGLRHGTWSHSLSTCPRRAKTSILHGDQTIQPRIKTNSV